MPAQLKHWPPFPVPLQSLQSPDPPHTSHFSRSSPLTSGTTGISARPAGARFASSARGRVPPAGQPLVPVRVPQSSVRTRPTSRHRPLRCRVYDSGVSSPSRAISLVLRFEVSSPVEVVFLGILVRKQAGFHRRAAQSHPRFKHRRVVEPNQHPLQHFSFAPPDHLLGPWNSGIPIAPVLSPRSPAVW